MADLSRRRSAKGSERRSYSHYRLRPARPTYLREVARDDARAASRRTRIVAVGVARTGNETTSDLFLFVRPDYKPVGEKVNLQGVCVLALGHWIGPRTVSRRLIRQHKCRFAGIYKDGSDGTRTRDLRRDRPSRARRRPTTDASEHPYLQAFSRPTLHRIRMVEPILQSAFGPGAGHKNLSSWTTQRPRPRRHWRNLLREEATQSTPSLPSRF
jgi:hypothetical protein